jgi:hypothetical protein
LCVRPSGGGGGRAQETHSLDAYRLLSALRERGR